MTVNSLKLLLTMTLSDLHATEAAVYVIDHEHPVRLLHASVLNRETLLGPWDDPLVQRVLDRAGPVIEGDIPAAPNTGEEPPYAAFLGMPLTGNLGEVRGIMAVAAEVPVTWTNYDLERARTLARLVAELLDVDHRLVHTARRLDRERAARKTRTALQKIAARTASAETPTDLARVLVDGFSELFPADIVVAALQDDNDVRYVHGTNTEPDVAAHWRNAPIDTELPIVHSVRTGETIELTDPEALANWPVLATAVQNFGLQGFAAFPICGSRGQPIAALGVGTASPLLLDQTDRMVLDELLSTTGRALERALEGQRTASVARDLQRSLLPPSIPTFDWLDIATLYQPVTNGTRVGGDWYDVVESGPDTIDLVVGDVAGHNIESAARMGQVRHVLASFLQSGDDPDQALASTDKYFTARRPPLMATALVIRLHRNKPAIKVSSAGHPSPIKVNSTEVEYLEVKPAGPIGSGFGGFSQTTFELEAGDVVASFTDGVFEYRAGHVNQDLDRLQDALAASDRTVDGVATALRQSASSTNNDDDAAAIVVHLRNAR